MLHVAQHEHGANLVALSLRLYRNGGTADGAQIVPRDWIEQSWTPRTRSRHSGEDYGYGWFIRELSGYPAYYGWGHGGQMIYVVPALELTVAITSDPEQPSARSGHQDNLHRLVAETVIPAAARRGAGN